MNNSLPEVTVLNYCVGAKPMKYILEHTKDVIQNVRDCAVDVISRSTLWIIRTLYDDLCLFCDV